MLQSQNRPEHHALKVCLGWDHMSASLLRRKLMSCSGSKFIFLQGAGLSPCSLHNMPCCWPPANNKRSYIDHSQLLCFGCLPAHLHVQR